MVADALPAPAREGAHAGSKWLVLAVLGIAQFMVVLDSTIVNVALPAIQRGLGFSGAGLQWVVTIYTLFLGGFLLLGGRAADLIGPRRMFVAGIAVFTVASAIDGAALSSGMLVAGRALQGLAAALVLPAAGAIGLRTFAEGRERRRVMGVGSAIGATGSAIGLVLGGALTEALSWRGVFFINLPIGVATILLALRYVPDPRADEEPESADVAGAVAVTGGLLLLIFGIVRTQQYGWSSWQTLGFGVAALALLGLFTRIEARSRAPLMRFGIFRLRSLTVANGVMMLVVGALFAMAYFLSIYAQEVLGYRPLTTGLAFLPFSAGIVIGAVASQRLIRRLGVRAVLAIGLALIACGELYFTRLSVDGTYVDQLLPGFVVISLGEGLAFVSLALIATTNVRAGDSGLVSGVNGTTNQVGSALGLAILSTLAASRTSHLLGSHRVRMDALIGGFHVGFGVGAALVAAALVLALVTLRARDVDKVDAEDPVALAA